MFHTYTHTHINIPKKSRKQGHEFERRASAYVKGYRNKQKERNDIIIC